MNIIQTILIALLNIVPKDIRKAALKAMGYTQWLKWAVETGEESGLLDWTELDEKLIQILNKVEANFGSIEVIRSLKPDARDGIYSHIGGFIVSEMTGRKMGISKTGFEITYNRNKVA